MATFDPSIALDRLYAKFYHLALSEKHPRTTTTTRNCSTLTSATLEMKEYEFPLLRDLVLQQQKNRNQCTPSWLPHVTLASIVGGTKADRIAFGEWLNGKTLSLDIASDKNDGSASKNSDVMANLELRIGSIHALGVGLGGPIPDIRDLILDWNFPFFDDAMVDTSTDLNENDKL